MLKAETIFSLTGRLVTPRSPKKCCVHRTALTHGKIEQEVRFERAVAMRLQIGNLRLMGGKVPPQTNEQRSRL